MSGFEELPGFMLLDKSGATCDKNERFCRSVHCIARTDNQSVVPHIAAVVEPLAYTVGPGPKPAVSARSKNAYGISGFGRLQTLSAKKA
jgi:hypothetical protein